MGLECATVKTKASDDDMKIINAALNAKTKSREAEPHRIFGGIGVELKKYDNLLEIVDFSNDSPARKTGIQTGDIILEINNISLEDISFDEAIQLLRGDSGTAVAITIKRNESIKPLLFNVKREIINFDTKDYKTVLDSTESFSFRIPENCIIETHNSNILDNTTANKLNNSENTLSTGESVNELSSELQKTQTGVIDSMACKGMAGLWNINSSAPREKVKINAYTYKNVCGVFGELLNNVHGTGKVTIKDCKLADNILLGTDHLHVSFIVKDQYTRYTYIFNYKGKQFTLFGQCSNQYSNECNKISYMTDDLASSLSEKGL